MFRVDNPHTKPFALWEWLITEIKQEHPETIFLSEAFTRPRVMHRLAKLGFSQSYTYFTWRNTRQELTEYFTELTRHPSREYFRPNVWPNTPDILPEYLQLGGRPAFMTRLVLAATLSANYGIYGPAFELLENQPRTPGSEEYLDSEKYEIRQRDLSHRTASKRSSPESTASAARTRPCTRTGACASTRSTTTSSSATSRRPTIWPTSSSRWSTSIRTMCNPAGWSCPCATSTSAPTSGFQVHDLLTDAALPLARRAQFRAA